MKKSKILQTYQTEVLQDLFSLKQNEPRTDKLISNSEQVIINFQYKQLFKIGENNGN